MSIGPARNAGPGPLPQHMPLRSVLHDSWQFVAPAYRDEVRWYDHQLWYAETRSVQAACLTKGNGWRFNWDHQVQRHSHKVITCDRRANSRTSVN